MDTQVRPYITRGALDFLWGPTCVSARSPNTGTLPIPRRRGGSPPPAFRLPRFSQGEAEIGAVVGGTQIFPRHGVLAGILRQCQPHRHAAAFLGDLRPGDEAVGAVQRSGRKAVGVKGPLLLETLQVLRLPLVSAVQSR